MKIIQIIIQGWAQINKWFMDLTRSNPGFPWHIILALLGTNIGLRFANFAWVVPTFLVFIQKLKLMKNSKNFLKK